MTKKSKLIYGGITLAVLIIGIALLQSGEDSLLGPIAMGPGGSGEQTSRNGASNGQRSRTTGQGDATENARRAKQAEFEDATAEQIRKLRGAAGGDAPRYGLDNKAIGFAVFGMRPKLRECYEGFERMGNTLPHDVNVSVTIAPDPADPSRGIVTRVQTSDSEFQHPLVENCLTNAVRDFVFEPPAQPIQARLPMEFARR